MDFWNDPMFIGAFVLQFGVLVGIIFRILLPYIQKKAEDPTVKFDLRYFWSGVLAWMLIQMEIFALFSQPINAIYGWTWQVILFFGFQVGLGNTELSARLLVGGASAITAYRARKAEETPMATLQTLADAIAAANYQLQDLTKRLEELEKRPQ